MAARATACCVLVAPHLRGDDVGRAADRRSAGSASTAVGSTASSARRRRARSRTSSATAASTSTASAGRATVRALAGQRLADRAPAPASPTIRELEQLSAVGASLRPAARRRRPVRRARARSPATSPAQLRQRGATVITADEPDPSLHAAAANRFAATVYVGFEPRTDAVADVAYYATAGVRVGRAVARWPSASPRAFDAAPRSLPTAVHQRHAPPRAARDADAGGRVLAWDRCSASSTPRRMVERRRRRGARGVGGVAPLADPGLTDCRRGSVRTPTLPTAC